VDRTAWNRPVTTVRIQKLAALAQRIAAALPISIVEEVVLTGSVSRGAADDVSDIEMLVVVSEPLSSRTASVTPSGDGADGDVTVDNVLDGQYLDVQVRSHGSMSGSTKMRRSRLLSNRRVYRSP